MGERDGAQALLERLRREERAAVGYDPDGTSYLDAADRIEKIRTAYRARLAADERESQLIDERRLVVVQTTVTAELL